MNRQQEIDAINSLQSPNNGWIELRGGRFLVEHRGGRRGHGLLLLEQRDGRFEPVLSARADALVERMDAKEAGL